MMMITFTVPEENERTVTAMAEYIKNPLSGKLRGVTYEDGKIIDVHIRDTDDVVKVFVPVRNGRWEEASDGDGIVCPFCRTDFCTIIYGTEYFNYCPHCGAKMDEKEG